MEIDLFGNIIQKEVESDVRPTNESPFVYMTAIQNKTYPNNFDTYSPFLTNLGFSQRSETVLFANELNKYADLGEREQFDFYFHALPKKNYFSKWAKGMKTEKTQMIMDYFKVSYKVAKQYERILQDKQLKQIEQWSKTHKGGKQ
tara:strand:- start:505 stop:939 length:435 start_codon:yes stop_codon:yes gene_type:complete